MGIYRNLPDSDLDHWAVTASLVMALAFSTTVDAAVANGTVAGRLRTTAASTYRIAGKEGSLASTDNFWNMSGEAATGAGEFRAYWLYHDGTFVAGTTGVSEIDALDKLPLPDATKSVIGTFAAGPSTNFAAALAAQGTISNGIPAGANIGVVRRGFIPVDVVQVLNT